MLVGVRTVTCTCGKCMVRTGGSFGGGKPTTDTYYCPNCEKHIIVVTPLKEKQGKFSKKIKGVGNRHKGTKYPNK